MRFYSDELKLALKGRFLHRCESWAEKLGCEALKAATEELGCGNLGAWCESLRNWETEESDKLKRKRATGKRAITEGERAFLNRYQEILGTSGKEKKKGKKEKDERNASVKTSSLLGYVKEGFALCLEEPRNIWGVDFQVPEDWSWQDYPETEHGLAKQLPTPCLKQKFPGLCSELGVSTPKEGFMPTKSTQAYSESFSQGQTTPKPANIAEDKRGGKIRTRTPIAKRGKLCSVDGGRTFTWREARAGSRAASSTSSKGATDQIYIRDVESRNPSSSTYSEPTYWHTGSTRTNDNDDVSPGKRLRYSIEEVEDDESMNLDTPVPSGPASSHSSLAVADPLQPLPRTEEEHTTTPQFWPPHPYSAGQTTTCENVPPTPSPADEAYARVLVAPWNRQIKVIQKQHQGLPSPRIQPHSPLSYMKSRKRRWEAKRREFVACQKSPEPQTMPVLVESPNEEAHPVHDPVVPAVQQTSPVTAQFLGDYQKVVSPQKSPDRGTDLDHMGLVSPSWYEPMEPLPTAGEKVVEWSENGVLELVVVSQESAGKNEPIYVSSSPSIPAAALLSPGLPSPPASEEEGELILVY